MGTLDSKHIIAEVAARHGIKIDPKDPMMAVVTLNELALMQFITPVVERIEAMERKLEKAAEALQLRAGKVLLNEMMELTFVLRTEIQTDFDDARLNAAKLIRELHEAHKRDALFRLVALSLTSAVIIFSLGFCIGWKL